MTKKMWGGRFSKRADPVAEQFTRSIHYDHKLAAYDIVGSLIHVAILARVGYITRTEASRLSKGLDSIWRDIERGAFKPNLTCEDIHTDIQNKLHGKAGDAALKLHTARSRNEQVVFATKLYCKDTILKTQKKIWRLVDAIAKAADENKNIIIPGFTHLQHAQPVYLKDHLWTYIEMLRRDDARLSQITHSIKITIGAGALAGTPIHAHEYSVNPWNILKSKGLGELKDVLNLQMTTNSLDAVSDRDFVIEAICALSLVATHLSRMAEDLIIWSTKEFGFIELDDSFCTGSSLMPQKKNPDSLELIRGYAGRIYGNLISALTMMKALPLAYNRDMQLDKEPLFGSFDTVGLELDVMSGIIKTIKFDERRIKSSLEDESLYATDLVYYLVDKGVPFKNAHTIVGKIVRHSIDNCILMKDIPEKDLKGFCPCIVKKEMARLFDPMASVSSKRSVKR